jgi:hypothetical protein
MDRAPDVEQERANTGSCFWHSDTETGLFCSLCGKWVCTRCMVQAPVGIRCRECGRAVPMPTYDVQPTFYARAAVAAVAIVVGGGILWGMLIMALVVVGLPFVSSIIVLGIGYGAGELISLSVNRKRSVGLAWLAGGSVIGAFLVGRLTLLSLLGVPTGFGFWGLGILFVIFGIMLAVQRVRP